MNQVEKLLQEAKLPQLLDREQMKKILLDNEYGYVPDIPFEMTVSVDGVVMEAEVVISKLGGVELTLPSVK